MLCRVPSFFRCAVGIALAALASQAAAGQAIPSPVASAARTFAGFPPGRCVIAGMVMEQWLKRGIPDTAAYTPREDTLARSTTDSLRLCAKSSLAAAPHDWEILNVARVHLLTGRDSLAGAVSAQRLAAMKRRPVQARAWELYLIVTDNLAGKPARLAPAYGALRSLDALGAAAAGERVMAHAAMVSVEAALQNDSAARAQSDSVVAAWNALPKDLRSWYANHLVQAIRTRAEVELFADRADDARAAIAAGLQLLPADARRAREALQRTAKMYDLVGKPTSPAQARFWFAAPASAAVVPGASAGTRPGKGKVAILLTLGRPCTHWCSALLAGTHRLRERFGDDESLELTFLTNTMGFYLDSAPATPEAEARYDSSYFLGERRVPGMIGVVETRYTWQSDGRRLDAPTANEVNYAKAFVVISDKRGIVRYIGGPWNREKEPRYTRVVERLMAES